MKEGFIPIDVRDFKIVDQREVLGEAALNRARVEKAKGQPMIKAWKPAEDGQPRKRGRYIIKR